MEKEKKNNNIGIIAILAVLLIAVLAFGIWAWSKYTTTLTGNGTAAVAKWDFGTSTELKNINLASASFYNVADKKIAPGTSGSFDVVVNANTSEVSIDYVITLSKIKNKPANLHFYKDAGHTQLADTLDTGDGVSYSGRLDYNKTNPATKTVTIYWDWAYTTSGNYAGTDTNYVDANGNKLTSNDDVDTKDGTNANNCTFDLTVTGTQVEPTAK